jgi:hypothetical protein
MKLINALDKIKSYYNKLKVGIDCKESEQQAKVLAIQD